MLGLPMRRILVPSVALSGTAAVVPLAGAIGWQRTTSHAISAMGHAVAGGSEV
jgi:hypothetical protein